MNSAKTIVCLVLTCVFLYSGILGCNAQAAAQPASVSSKAQLKEAKKAKAAATAKAKREKKAREAEILKAKREAAKKAKREAAAQAKAKREDKARLAKLDAQAKKQDKAEIAQAKKQAKAEIAQAKKDRQSRLAQLNAKARKQTKELAKKIKAEKASLKRKFEDDKAKLAAEHKQAKAKLTKKDQAKLAAEHKKTIAQLEAEHKAALKNLDGKARTQAAQIALVKSENKARLAQLEKDAKKQVKQAKAERTSLKRKFDADKAKLAAEHKQARARLTKKEKARLDAEYKNKIKQLDTDHKDALVRLNDKAGAQAAQTTLAKSQSKARLAQLETEVKKQTKAIKAEKESLKRKLSKDKARAAAEHKQAKAGKISKQQKSRLEAEYKRTLSRLKAEYKEALARLKERADTGAVQIAQAKEKGKAELAELDARAKQQAKEIKAEKQALKQELADGKAETKIYGTAKVDADYKESLSQLKAAHKEALAKIKADTGAAQIAQTKSDNKAELAELDARAKQQTKEIKAEKEALKQELADDKAEAKIYGIAKVNADYKEKLGQLEADYKEALANLKADAEATKIARRQIEAEYQEKIAKINIRLKHSREKPRIAKLKLPEDTTPRLAVKEIQISGNVLITTAELLDNMPTVYNASDKPLEQADSADLYDFSAIYDVILGPGQPHEVSARTIQGFTRYILSAYQSRNYGGIYVYVPTEAISEGTKLQNDILPINVLEAPVTEVTIKMYDPEQNEKEKGYLRTSAVKQWSPVKPGQVANQKELDDFVNLLNLNPDRYVSAVVTKGTTPNSLAVGYDIYEADPWHYFIQVDNSGTKDRRWAPRIGMINTNLLGIDDTFIAIYQARPDSTINEDYSLYGSYDFPLAGPKLRLNLYGGYSEFDINPDSGSIDFLGSGSFYGGILRYNLFQKDGWFFDVLGSLSHEESKVTPSVFPTFLATDLKMDFWGCGVDIHRSDDMSETQFTFDRTECVGGSDRNEFTLSRARTSPDFIVYTAAAAHNQYLDPNKVGRFSGTFRWIGSNERLAPAKMTSFGGMYSIRGYDELEIVADGGILASVQYEFDIVKYNESMEPQAQQEQAEAKKPYLRKLAPLVFADYGRAKIKDHTAITEKTIEELASVGVGTIIELGDHLSGALYYGYPLRSTANTREGKGRVNVSAMVRW